jgi:L-ascorbate metabolism protein UlaG (beta-lactamase superfamily)
MGKYGSFAGASLALSTLFAMAAASPIAAQAGVSILAGAEGRESDSFETGSGQLRATFLGHASLVFEFGGKRIYIDPVRQYGDFSKFPKADLILVTHEHGDHLDAAVIAALTKPGTRVILPEASRKKLGSGEALDWGDSVEAAGLSVKAVAACNSSPGRGQYHPRERKDNGYVLSAGSLRIYVAGDTEPIPEMGKLGSIDIAFLPMNLPYTMTSEQVAEAALAIKPRILYPYHFGNTDTGVIAKLLAHAPGIELRLRKLQ